MSDAAPQVARGMSAAKIGQALEVLLLYGDEFLIGCDEQGWWAASRGRIDGIERAGDRKELGEWMNSFEPSLWSVRRR